jgi:tetratricopeptide (TPR) repeat protein
MMVPARIARRLSVESIRKCRCLGFMLCFALLLVAAQASRSFAFDKLPESHPSYVAIKKVYLNVARAFGDGRKPPHLFVKAASSKTGPKIAMFYPGTEGFLTSRQKFQESAIVIDEKAFDLLHKEFGAERDSALAVLIGHELVHFYNKQGWVAEFGNAFADSETGQQMTQVSQADEVIRYEAEADEFGGFYAYLAGYDSLGMAPQVIEKIYAGFKLPSDMSGYPNKEERKKIAIESQKGLKEMIPLFDTANRLLVIGRYEEAARLFDYIGRSFPSREILNNAGVARALAAIGLFRPGELKFAFPFEFDAETRLRSQLRTKGFGDSDEERRKELLEQALHDFDSAIARDPAYAVAYVNRAAVYELADDHARALLDAEKGLELARQQQEEITIANAFIIHGIILARQKSDDKAASDFNAAKVKVSSLANLNLQALKGQPKGKGFAADGKLKRAAPAEIVIERIGGLTPEELRPRSQGGNSAVATTPLNPPSVERELSGAIGEENKMKIYIKETPQWSGSAVMTADASLFLLATPPGYQGVSGRGVKIGSTLDDLVSRYGDAPRVVPSRQGTHHVYPKLEMVFSLGPDNLVTGWMEYFRVRN